MPTLPPVPPQPAGASLEVYPNPGVETANIKLVLEKPGRIQLQLLDVLGHTVIDLPAQSVPAGELFQSIDIPAGLPAGMYLIRCNIEGRQPLMLRWMKN